MIVGRVRPSPPLNWLDPALEVLVFTPVASMWFGLMVAAAAYRSTLNDRALAGQSFLQRWQGGFDHHIWGGLYFDQVARITIVLVCLVLVLALGAHKAHHAPVRRAERRCSKAAQRLLGSAARMLPTGDRARYAEEFGSELAEISRAGGGRRAQLAYAVLQVLSAWQLRRELQAPRRRRAVR